jgi:hypothetical protein
MEIKLKDLKFNVSEKNNEFNQLIQKLNRDIYQSKYPFPREEQTFRNAFQKPFTDLMNSTIEKLKIQTLLIYLLQSVTEPLLNRYNEIYSIKSRFMFRGGNVLKMYKDSLENKNEKQFIKKNFGEFFEFSDIDFMVYIQDENDMTANERREHRDKIQLLIHYSLSICRDLIKYYTELQNKIDINSKELFHEVDNIKNELENELISSSTITELIFLFINNPIKDLNPTEVTNTKLYSKNYQDYKFFGYNDIVTLTVNNQLRPKFIVNTPTEEYIIFKDDQLNQIIQSNLETSPIQYFYITDNDRVKNIESNIFFRLSRLLVCFGVQFTNGDVFGLINTFGELYDVSIINKGDIMYNIYNDRTTEMIDLKFKFQNDNFKFKVRIPKLETSIEDLIRILFLNRFPWSVPKYEKRIYRLYLLLYFRERKNVKKETIQKFLKNADQFNDNRFGDLKIIDLKTIRRNYNYMKRFDLGFVNRSKLNDFGDLIGRIEKLLSELNELK